MHPMTPDRPRFALLTYQTDNLGDEIQSIAARQFLPTTDLLIDRDSWEPGVTCAADPHKIILNGWFTHAPERWPPPPILDPLVISFHVTSEIYKLSTSRLIPSDILVAGENLAYLRRHQPIGARDLRTRQLLSRHGIDSYFSGCLTLTLGQDATAARADYVCAVDLETPLYDALQARTHGRTIRVGHSDRNGGTFAERAALASSRLSLYAHAKCVVTTRLHCALPCLALQTPVLLISAAPDTYRFSGLIDLLHHCSEEQFMRGNVDFDSNDPPPNGDAHLALRHRLIERVTRFTGHMSPFRPAPLSALREWLLEGF
jgi:hypothetical protein